MKKIAWSPALSVGNGLIDSEHQEWIKRLADVQNAVNSGMKGEKISETLDFMLEYTKNHFENEEKLMQESSYPGIDIHKKDHEKLKSTLAELVRDFREDGPSPQLSEAVNSTLHNWLLSHISERDKAVASHVSSKKKK